MRLIGVLGGLFVVLGACVTPAVPRTLGWRAAAPATPIEGNVVVGSVKNRRPQDRGGGDSSLVGYARNQVEDRAPLVTDDASGPLLLSVRGLVTDALRSAGIAVSSDSSDGAATALVNVDVLELWSDGVAPAKGRIVLDLIVLDPTTHAERARVRVAGEGAVDSGRVSSSVECTKDVTSAPCASFVLPMNAVYRDIMSAFQQPELRAAAIGKKAHAPGE